MIIAMILLFPDSADSINISRYNPAFHPRDFAISPRAIDFLAAARDGFFEIEDLA
ncbi:MAG TPA: hypothetical protein VJ385_09185 [Fibrobacteria bacterium]|nr:hypothetical protein [Fibrobacteria bacterium]